jgi:hypothetical protein
MRTSAKMGLRVWNLLLDPYDHEQLADNWAKVDAHDHSPGRGVLIPTEAIAFEAISFPLIASSIFPKVSAAPASTVTITAAEEKTLAGGPSIEALAAGEYEIGLSLTGTINTTELTTLKGSVCVNGTPTYTLFNWASATKEATITTTNFARAELKEKDVLTVGCHGSGHSCTFSQGRIAIWRVK